MTVREVLIGLVGATAGYFAARAFLQHRYDQMLDEEITRTKEFFGANYEGTKDSLDDPEFMEAAIDAAESITAYAGGGITVTPSVLAAKVEQTVTNYAQTAAPDTKAARVAAKPAEDPDARDPYVITFEEFDAGELEHEQITVSYFAGDGIVIDEDDSIIAPARVEATIGTDNLNKFGTNIEDPNMDPNTLYIRCEQYSADYEVTRSPGKHSVEVLGEAE